MSCKLNPAGPEFVAKLRTALPRSAFRDVTPTYLEEPRGRWKGKAGVIVAPESTEHVAAAVRLAAQDRVPVIPYGGGTGLVSGQISPDGPDPMLLSLERMRRVRGVYPEENVIEVEAGAILEDVQVAATEVGRLFPLSIAASGSARIGGNLATNAGGVNVLRYGNARDLCLGIEAVMPDGKILHGLRRLRKDNMGYDLKNLLIGSEGTLGVITAATLKLFSQPAENGTALMVVETPDAALSLLHLARERLGETISAFELMHRTGLEFLAETMPDVRQPFETQPDWLVLIDIGLARGADPSDALEALFADAFENGLVGDGLIAQSLSQREAFWNIRENIPEANRRIGSVNSHDISVPLGAISEFIARGAEVISEIGDFRINCFGHLGDGNLHYNIFPPKGQTREALADLRPAVKQGVHDLVHSLGGSVSAEHGVGRFKVGDLETYGDPVAVGTMRAIKAAIDPAGIMNPGAVLHAT